MRKLLKIARIYLIAQNTDLDPLCCGWRRLCHGLGNGGSDGGTTWCRRCGCVPVSVCHQFLTLAPVLSKLGLCGKSTVFTYEIGFLGMLRNRLWRSSRFFVKKNKEAHRVLSHTTGLLSSSALKDALSASNEALLDEKSAFPWKRAATITRPDRRNSAFTESLE